MDFRVDVVGTAGEDDAVAARLLQVPQSLLALFLDVAAGSGLLLPGGMGCGAHFHSRKVAEYFDDAVCEDLFIGESEERIHKMYGRIPQLLDVVLDVLRITGDDGAVVVVDRFRELISFVRNAGIEDELHTLSDQPGHMPVGQLGRIALGFAGDGFDTQLIHFMCGSWQEHHFISEFGEKCKPKRIVLKHVEDAGNADLAAGRLVLCQRRVAKDPLVLVVIEVWQMVLVLLLADTALAAVAGDVLPAAGEMVDRQAARIGASVAVGHGCGILEFIDFFNGKHGSGAVLVVTLTRDEGRSERAHDPGDVGPDHFAVRNLFKCPKDGVIVKCPALHHNIVPELRCVGHLDDFI